MSILHRLSISALLSLSALLSAAPALAQKPTMVIGIKHSDSYQNSVIAGIKAELGDKFSYEVAVFNDDPAKEQQLYSQWQVRKPAYVVTSPVSSTSSLAAVKAMSAAGIKVLCFDTCLGEQSDQAVKGFAATDHREMGVQVGKVAAAYINQHMGGKATVGIIQCNMFVECQWREAAFKEELAKAGVKASYPAEEMELFADKATTKAENMLLAHPGIDLMWGGHDGSTTGITTAVSNNPKYAQRVKVFGEDISPVIAKRLTQTPPVLMATSGQDGEKVGKAVARMVARLDKGEAITPFKTLVPPTLIQRGDNLTKYLAQ